MASAQRPKYADGRTVHRVLLWQGGKQSSLTYGDTRTAENARKLIEALGPDEAVPRLEGRSSTGPASVPTVAEWLDRHVEDSIGVTARTGADYRS